MKHTHEHALKISQQLSNKMANMSFVCSILIVALHTISSYPGVRFVVAIGVPYFFIASGFFLAAHVDEQGWYKQAIQKRIKTLVVPFFVWFFIGVLVYTPMNIVADVLAHRPFGSSISFLHTSLLGKFGLQFNEFPIGLGALWYVRGLFMLVLASPLLVWCVKKMKWAFPIIALLSWLFYRYFLASTPMDKSFPMGLLGVGFPMMGFCYFTLGIYLGRHPIKTAHQQWGGVASLLLGIVLSLLACRISQFVPSTIADRLGLPFVLYGIWAIMPSSKWPVWLTSLSFPIFLLHGLFTAYLSLLLPCLNLSAMLVRGLVFALTVVLCFVFALGLRRFVPRLAAVLFGGR